MLLGGVCKDAIPVATGWLTAVEFNSIQINLIEQSPRTRTLEIEEIEFCLIPGLGTEVSQRLLVGVEFRGDRFFQIILVADWFENSDRFVRK